MNIFHLSYTKVYIVFKLMTQIILLRQFHLPARKVRHLTFGMRLFPPMYHFSQVFVCLFFLALSAMSLSTHKSPLSIGIILSQIFWNLILLVAARQSMAILILEFQESFFIMTYFKYRFQYLKIKLGSSLNLTRKWRLIDNHLFHKRINARSVVVHLKECTQMCVSLLQFQKQLKYMFAIVYFAGSAFLEVFLFLALSPSSNGLMRQIAIDMVISLGLLYFAVLHFMGELNSKSKLLLPELNYLLHKVKGHRGRKTSAFFLAERVEMLATNRIAIDMAGIFPMTRFVLLQLCFTLVQNALLILDLNDTH